VLLWGAAVGGGGGHSPDGLPLVGPIVYSEYLAANPDSHVAEYPEPARYLLLYHSFYPV